jgi:hypothetical protein
VREEVDLTIKDVAEIFGLPPEVFQLQLAADGNGRGRPAPDRHSQYLGRRTGR